MSNKIRLGVIGCGIISGMHLDAIQKVDDAEVSAICDRDEKKLNTCGERYGVARRYTDWRALLEEADIDAVVICLPEGLHKPVAVESALHGKHILVEKPMAKNLAECDEMITIAEQSDVILMVGQVVRYFANHVIAKQWLMDGKIGKVTKVARRRFLKNAFPDLKHRPWINDRTLAEDWLLYGFGSHEYDAILWLLNTEAEWVTATGQKVTTSGYTGWGRISSTSRLRNGVSANVELSLSNDRTIWETELIGSEGNLVIRSHSVALNGVETKVSSKDFIAFRDQMVEFVQCIKTQCKLEISGKNVRKSMAWLEAVKDSLEEKCRVYVEHKTKEESRR